MKKRNEIISIILVLFATVGTVFGIFVVERYRRTKLFTVELIARAPEHGNWYPKELNAPFGEEVTIMIRNIETVSHGFALPDFDIAVREIKGGEVVVVKFIPDKRGTFPFMCTVWCSDHHMDMRGELIVE